MNDGIKFLGVVTGASSSWSAACIAGRVRIRSGGTEDGCQEGGAKG